MTFNTTRPTRHAAFSFIEVMAVIVIIGLLAAAVSYNFLGQVGRARTSRVKTDMSTIAQAVSIFQLEKGRVPSNRDGLKALKDLESDIDPWGNAYVYTAPGPDGAAFELKSYGADGKPGGSDDDGDLLWSVLRKDVDG